MKKSKIFIIIITILFTLIILGVFGYLIYNKYNKIDIVFNYADEANITKEIEVNTEEFIPDKMSVTINGEDMTKLLKIDISEVDLTKVGKYNIRYYLEYKKKIYEEYYEIEVVDTTKPEIILKGKNVTLLLNEKYEEPGYEVKDNYDKDLMDKVEVKSEVDTSKAGTYKITYNVTDASGNKADEKTREVKVKKPNVVVATPPKEVKVEVPKVVVSEYSNTIKKNKFTSSSINLEGYLKEVLEEIIIK